MNVCLPGVFDAIAISLLYHVISGNGSPVGWHERWKPSPSTTITDVLRANIVGATTKKRKIIATQKEEDKDGREGIERIKD